MELFLFTYGITTLNSTVHVNTTFEINVYKFIMNIKFLEFLLNHQDLFVSEFLFGIYIPSYFDKEVSSLINFLI